MLETAINQITPEWLTSCFHRNKHLPQGKVIAVKISASDKHHYALEVEYTHDVPDVLPRNLILKWYSDGYGTREGYFYKHIVPAMHAPPVPVCFDVGSDREGGQTYILLEDLSTTHYTAIAPYSDLDQDTFESVMQAYTKIHAHWWEHPKIGQEAFLQGAVSGVAHEAITPKTIRGNERYFADEVLPSRVNQYKEQIPDDLRRLCEIVIASWANKFIQRIERGTGLTLIQGDAQLGNILLPRDPLSHTPVIIDWEGCTRGLGVWDLARTLIQTEFPSETREKLEKTLLSRYHSQLVEQGIRNYSIAQCMADYRLSVLANIPHALVWESHSYLESAIRAFYDWECEKLLD